MKSPVLQITDLTKSFVCRQSILRRPFASPPVVHVLNGLTFSIQSPTILGILGPNGAGKTSLLRILAGLLQPDSGQINLLNHPFTADQPRLRTLIGFVPSDERSFFWRLTGLQNLDFFARLYGLSAARARPITQMLLDHFDLADTARRLFRDYSAGTRKKFSLIRSLLHQPPLLLLDELTNSLDADSAHKAKTLVSDYITEKPGRAAIWCTHRREEIAQICDRVMYLHAGRIKPVELAASPDTLNPKYESKSLLTCSA